MKIGHKVYYSKLTGVVILTTGEQEGWVAETTLADDILNYPSLQNISSDIISFIQCDYGYMPGYFKKFRYSIDITKNPIDQTSIIWDMSIPVRIPVHVKNDVEILQEKVDASQDYSSTLNDTVGQFMDFIFANDESLPQ